MKKVILREVLLFINTLMRDFQCTHNEIVYKKKNHLLIF